MGWLFDWITLIAACTASKSLLKPLLHCFICIAALLFKLLGQLSERFLVSCSLVCVLRLFLDRYESKNINLTVHLFGQIKDSSAVFQL